MQKNTDMANTAADDEISLLCVLHFLTKHKKIVLGAPLITMLFASFAAALMPDVYTAKLKMIPHQQTTTPQQQTQLVQLVLESESFTSNLVQRFNLVQAYGTADISEAHYRLKENTRIKPVKDGIIEIEVDDIDPERATTLVNAYPKELDKFITSHELSDIAKQLKKTELRIKKLQEQLDRANNKLNEVGKAISANKQMDAEKEKNANIAMLKAQLDFILDMDSANVKIMPSLDRLREQLDAIHFKDSNKPAKEMSSADQNYLEHFGQVKYLESSIDSLKKQQTRLMIDEQMSNTQVLDIATTPQEKSKPKRLLIVVSVTLVAVFLAVLLLLLKEWIAAIRKQIRQAAPGP